MEKSRIMTAATCRPQPDQSKQLAVGSQVLPDLMGYEDIMEDQTNTASVPEDDVAKLMYYLNCMSLLKDLTEEPLIEKLTDYKNYQQIKDSSEDLNQLLTAVGLNDPTFLFLKERRLMRVGITGSKNKNPCRLMQRQQDGQTQLEGAVVSYAEETNDRFLFCTNRWISDYYDIPKRKIEVSKGVKDAIKVEQESASKRQADVAEKARMDENARMKKLQEEKDAIEQRARMEAQKEAEEEQKAIEEQLAKDKEQERLRKELERQKIEVKNLREQNAQRRCLIS